MPDDVHAPAEVPDDPIAEIDDRIARGIARTIVHVRRFLPFYAGGIAFAVAMAVLPVVNGGGGGTPTAAVGPDGAAGAAAGSAGRLASAAAPGLVDEGVLDDVADAAGGAGSTLGGRTSPMAGPGLPDASEAPDIPDTPDAPDACQLALPSPAPSVSPERELSGAQQTAEAAAGQQLPADLGQTVSPVSQQALCSAPEPPVEVPAVPVPPTPVSRSGGPSAPVAVPDWLPLAALLAR